MDDRIQLADGGIPRIGFGCYNAFGEEMKDAIRWAVECGYRYIDSAACYKNEAEVGESLQNCGVAREELFILSKVWPTDYDNVEKAAMRTMRDLRIEYLDCYLLHWPTTDEARRMQAYEQLLKLKERGICKTAAVSNFLPAHMEALHREFGHYPVLNELEIHPRFQQRDAIRYMQEKNIQMIAYTPIDRGAYLNNAAILQIAQEHGKTPNQIVLRWHLQKGHIPIPKSSNQGRIRENISLFDFALTEREMQAVDALEVGARRGNDPLVYNG